MMTAKATDDYVFNTVANGVGIATIKLPPQMQMPAMDEAKEKMAEVIEEYDLGDLDFSSMIRVQVNGQDMSKDKDKDEDKDDEDKDDDGSEDKESDKEKAGSDDKKKKMTPQEKALAAQEELRAQVMEAVDKDDKRWEIVKAIREAQEGTPFGRNSLTGEVDDTDSEKGHVFLTIERSLGGAGAPPSVVKMKQAKDGSWQYDGIDPARTTKKMRKFMQEMQRRAPGGGQRFKDDF